MGSPEAAQRFQREARAAAGFPHPNVVTVYDYGVEAGTRAFLVMELLEGATLRDELRRGGGWMPARWSEIFRGLCSAVEAAHARHLIHRDLKPENIFLARGGGGGGETVKVLDFGIAKFLPGYRNRGETRALGETDAGILVGTPGYMSPEQLLGEAPACPGTCGHLPSPPTNADGRAPVPPSRHGRVAHAVLAGPLRAGEHLASPPAAWEEFFATLWRRPRRTPRSAAEFLRDLERALGACTA